MENTKGGLVSSQQPPAGLAHLKAKKGHPLLHREQLGLSSPTDNIMSPCTQKIVGERQQALKNMRPKTLASQFEAIAKQDESQ